MDSQIPNSAISKAQEILYGVDDSLTGLEQIVVERALDKAMSELHRAWNDIVKGRVKMIEQKNKAVS